VMASRIAEYRISRNTDQQADRPRCAHCSTPDVRTEAGTLLALPRALATGRARDQIALADLAHLVAG
jgi:hypothetical protein